MSLLSFYWAVCLLVLSNGEETTLTLQDVAQLLQQNQATLLNQMNKQLESFMEQVNRQQQSLAQQMNRQQESFMEQVNRQQRHTLDQINTLTTKVNEVTEQVKELVTQDAEVKDKKRMLVDGEINVQQAVVSLDRQIKNLQASSGSGASYTRWGKTTCPGNGTDRVYQGYAAGTYFNSKGGGSNYLCLPTDPTWGYYLDGHQDGADVYGAEYEFGSTTTSHFFSSIADDDDVPCAVCRSQRPTSLMIPGRNVCYPGWTLEYSGYLVGEYSGFDSSEFVCMDTTAEAIPHGGDNRNGAMFYLVEVNCGSLACPPYKDGRELACVVCSK